MPIVVVWFLSFNFKRTKRISSLWFFSVVKDNLSPICDQSIDVQNRKISAIEHYWCVRGRSEQPTYFPLISSTKQSSCLSFWFVKTHSIFFPEMWEISYRQHTIFLLCLSHTHTRVFAMTLNTALCQLWLNYFINRWFEEAAKTKKEMKYARACKRNVLGV